MILTKKIIIGRGRFALELLSPLAIFIGAALWLLADFLQVYLDPIAGNTYVFAVALVVFFLIMAVPQIMSLFARVLLLPISVSYEAIEDVVMLILFIIFYGLIADSFIQAKVSHNESHKTVGYVLLSFIGLALGLALLFWIGFGLAITSNS